MGLVLRRGGRWLPWCSRVSSELDLSARLRRAISVASLLAASGCAQIVGIEEWTAASGAGGSTAQSTGTGAACACVPSAPPEWSGPIYVQTMPLASGACAPTDTEAFIAHTGMIAPDTCGGCECAPSVENCTAVQFGWGVNGTCATPLVLKPEACEPLGTNAELASARATGSFASMPSCGIGKGSAPHPDPITWTETWAACTPAAGSTNETCDATGERCFPGGRGPACVFKLGDNPCPAETGYSEQQIVHSNAMDMRTCPECDCGSPAEDVTCAGFVETFADTGCSGEPLQSIAAGATSCTTLAKQTVSAARFSPMSLGKCTAGVTHTNGGATPSEPITICCRPG